MLNEIDDKLKKYRYGTRTEFIRDAVRTKLIEFNKDELIKEFLKFNGKAKKKTTSNENKKTAERVLLELAKERGWEIK